MNTHIHTTANPYACVLMVRGRTWRKPTEQGENVQNTPQAIIQAQDHTRDPGAIRQQGCYGPILRAGVFTKWFEKDKHNHMRPM